MLNPFDFLNEQQPTGSHAGNGTAVAELPPPQAEPVMAEPAKAATPKPRATKSSSARQCLYLDLETIPDESRQHLFELPALPEIIQPAPETADADMMPPAEWVTQDVAAAKQTVSNRNPSMAWIDAARAAEIAKVKGGSRKGIFDLLDSLIEMKNIATKSAEERKDAAEKQRKDMATTPEMCRIVSMGWAVGDEVAEAMTVGQLGLDGKTTVTETMILEKVWALIAHHSPIVGFRVLGFDLPVIFIRSALLDVDPSKKIDMRPWGTDVVDLMEARYPRQKATGLKTLAKLLGIPVPAEGVDGSQVAELFATDPAKVSEYVRSDIAVTRALHKKFKGFFV